MRGLSTTLSLLLFTGIAVSQTMTDRDLAGYKGRVKSAQRWSQKLGPDGKPAEEAKTDSETTYDEEGNITEATSFVNGKRRTTYFLFKGDRVSKSEVIGEDPAAKIKLPSGFIPIRKKNKGPFDCKYKYKYDKNGRIIEISGEAEEGWFSSRSKYVYDDAGRIVSEKEFIFNGGLETTRTFKYDDNGNLTETVSKTNVHTLKGIGNDGPTVSYANIKDGSTVRYSDQTFDTSGNWTKSTATVLDKKGKVESVTLAVRYITYY